MEIPVHIQESRGGKAFRAFCPDLPGCSATAESPDAALEVLRGRITEYFNRDAAHPAPLRTRRTVLVL